MTYLSLMTLPCVPLYLAFILPSCPTRLGFPSLNESTCLPRSRLSTARRGLVHFIAALLALLSQFNVVWGQLYT